MVDDAGDAGRLPHEQWAPIFAGGQPAGPAQDVFLSHVIRIPHESVFTWPRGRIEEIARRLPDSSPGPDGVSYTVWGHLPPGFAELLDDIASDMTQGVAASPQMLQSYTSHIPKAEHRDDTDGLAVRKAAELMQTSAKLVAYVVNEPLGQIAERTVCGQQRGSVRIRLISDNVVELEGHMAMYSQSAERCAEGLLLDFANAFPSLDHTFMWRVREAMALPEPLVLAIQWLFKDLFMEVLYKGHVVGGFLSLAA